MLNSVRAIYLPYCLHQRKDKHWVILNRNYKPVGVLNDDQADYYSFPADVCIKSITPAQAAKISYTGERDNSSRIYLYNDGCVPTINQTHMDAYLARVAVLMKLKTSGVNS